jgi:hypothetical protein
MAGDERTIGCISPFSFSFSRPITPSFRLNNELLYFYSSSVLGCTSNECRHIADAEPLAATLIKHKANDFQ